MSALNAQNLIDFFLSSYKIFQNTKKIQKILSFFRTLLSNVSSKIPLD